MQMLKISTNQNEYRFILDNLREEDKQELYLLWGNNWYDSALQSLKDTEVLVFCGKNKTGEIVPVAMGGFHPVLNKKCKIACVWLLSTRFVKYNKTSLMRVIKQQVLKASLNYEIMYNFIYSSNFLAKMWLKKLGFCFDNPKPKNIKLKSEFEFFYKVNTK